MIPPERTAAVTGANGYLGSRVASRLSESGWNVRELTSTPATPEQVSFTLLEGVEAGGLKGVDALVHCAYDFRPRGWEDIDRVNVLGTERLLTEARSSGIDSIVQISSMSAFEGARSLYGRAKLAIERCAAAVGADVVRPGLVFAPGAGGIISSLRELVMRRKLLPVPRSRGRLQLVHERDLCDFVVDLAAGEAGAPGAPRVAAHQQAHRLEEVAATLALALHRRPRLVPIPWRVGWLGLRAAEAFGAHPDFRSDSLLSLATLVPQQPLEADSARFRPYTTQTVREQC